eukprot:m.158467 g.158467  ORF g.158467 m.158467 type:complete len:50 (+) comp24757_c0_seq2:95-244(+)
MSSVQPNDLSKLSKEDSDEFVVSKSSPLFAFVCSSFSVHPSYTPALCRK